MAIKNPISMIKNVVVGSLKAPVAVGRSAVGAAVGAASSLLPDRSDAISPVDTRPAAQPAPVNVTEELGIDPAPVAKPKRKVPAKTAKPVTTIDAAADPSAVTVTPADVAEVVAGDAAAAKGKAPAKKPAAK